MISVVDRPKCELEHSIKMINMHLRANSLRQRLRVHSHCVYAVCERVLVRERGHMTMTFNYRQSHH